MKVQKYKKDLHFTYALGATLVLESFKTNNVLEVYFKENCKLTDPIIKIKEMCKEKNIPLIVNVKPFNVLTNKENCFVIAKVEKKQTNLTNENHIVLVNPSDAGNMGTIMRTALGFGFNNIVVIKDAVDAYSPKVVRSSMGAIFSLNIKYYDSINDYISEFKNHTLYSFMLNAKTKLKDVGNINLPYSLVFGNEATGLPSEYLNFTNPIIIPKKNAIDSFSLQIAAGIAMYEFTKKDF